MTATLPLLDIPVPIHEWPGGGYKVVGTRVSLESVIFEYKSGSDAEAIHASFPTVEVAMAAAVIAYYHANREAVDAYLEESIAEEERSYREHIALHPQPSLEDFRKRLNGR